MKKTKLIQRYSNNWYTIETQPSDPFVLRGQPPFTFFPPEDRDRTDSRRTNKIVIK